MVKGNILGGDRASRQGAGGVLDHGMHEEVTPVTWDPLDCPLGTIRRCGEPVIRLRRAVRMSRQGRPVQRPGREASGAPHAEQAATPKVGAFKRRSEKEPMQQGSPMAAK